MDAGYVLTARRDPSRSETLTLRYESRELALAAAATIRELGSIVVVTAPDGSSIAPADTAQLIVTHEGT